MDIKDQPSEIPGMTTSLSGTEAKADSTSAEQLARALAESRLREESLQSSRQILQELADTSPFPSFLFELGAAQEMILVGSNRAAERCLGGDAWRFHGKSLIEAFPSVERTELPKAIRNAMTQHQTSRLKGPRFWDQSGTEDYLVLPAWSGQGRVVLVVAPPAEGSAASEEVRKLSRAVEQSPAAIVITDTSGNIEYVNPKFTQMSGYSAAEVAGKNPRILKSGSVPASVYRQLWATITAGNEWRGEILNKKKNGDFYWQFNTISPIKDSSGRITHFLAVNEDITQRKRAEEALRISEDSLRVIFNSVYDAIFIHELNGSLVDLNEKSLQLFGITRDQALTMSVVDDLSSPDNPREEFPDYWKKAVMGENQFFEWKAKRPRDGFTFSVEIFLRRISLRGKQAILATVRDISERKRMQEQLYQSQRMESISSVVGSIAHEFNNTLNNVLGFATLIKKYIDDQTKVIKYSTAIEQSVIRSADLGSRLLSFAKETKRESAPIDLASLLTELVDRAQKSVGPGIAIEKRLESDLLRILGDRQELSQALLNLIVNAKEAILARQGSNKGGHILLSADNSIVSEDNAAKLMLPAGSSCVVLRVSDNGIGIPESIRDRIFDPFFTTKEQNRGTGLGLSIAFSTVRTHRGTIFVESLVDKGTTFKIFLPAHELKKPERGGSPGSAGSNGGGDLILLVDDEPAMREIGTEILQGEGYAVLTASNGLEAVDTFKKQPKQIVLVVLDLVMPKMDGGQTLLELRKINPAVKCVFCTGFASDAIITQLLAEEHIPAIQKPFQHADFLRVIQEVLSKVEG
jgi:PAS domain S-box-containing protein